jgi:hypothetical protein
VARHGAAGNGVGEKLPRGLFGMPAFTLWPALTLNRLGEREIAAMIARVRGNKPLPESVRQDIIERTDGVPLFVEEMTKAVPGGRQ